MNVAFSFIAHFRAATSVRLQWYYVLDNTRTIVVKIGAMDRDGAVHSYLNSNNETVGVTDLPNDALEADDLFFA